MKQVLLISVMMLAAQGVLAKTFTCKHVFSKRMDEVVSFDSKVPKLEKTVHFFNEDGSFDTSETKVFVSANQTCGSAIDFKKECSVKSEDAEDTYRFSFACRGGAITGHLLMYSNGYGVFSCNNEVGTQFFDCQ